MTDERAGFKDRLLFIIGEKSVSSFGKECGLNEGSLRAYLKGSFPRLNNLVSIVNAAGVNLEWLATGQGPIYKGEEDTREEGKVAAPAPWQPAPPRVDSSQPPLPDAAFDTLGVVEGMGMLTKIYGSGDITYIRAINANLMAFSDAITAKTTNQTMQGQLNKLEDRLATLEHHLESPPKAANGD